MRSKPTLLVVDPDLSRRTAAERAWRRAFRVVCAADACTALEAMRLAPPAVVFAEWDLPDIDGTALERVVRASTELCAVPIVFTLGWKSRERLVQQLVGAGLIDHLDDHCFSTLVRGVTALTRGTPRGRARSTRGGASASAGSSAPSSGSRDPEDGRAYLAKRLMIA